MFVLLHYILCTSKNKALIVRKVLVCHRSMTQIYRKLWFRFRISSHWLIQVDLISPCVTRRGFLVFCCLFSHMESHSGRNCSAALGPVPANHPLDAFFSAAPPRHHMFSCAGPGEWSSMRQGSEPVGRGFIWFMLWLGMSQIGLLCFPEWSAIGRKSAKRNSGNKCQISRSELLPARAAKGLFLCPLSGLHFEPREGKLMRRAMLLLYLILH